MILHVCLKGLIQGINELTACKALLQPHLAAADAGLAELALSIPLAQVTAKPMLSCLLLPHAQILLWTYRTEMTSACGRSNT